MNICLGYMRPKENLGNSPPYPSSSPRTLIGVSSSQLHLKLFLYVFLNMYYPRFLAVLSRQSREKWGNPS